MSETIHLKTIFSEPRKAGDQRLSLFALLNLGVLADEIMSRGVQLTDLFNALPADEAQREFQRELAAMRSLCLSLLEEKRLAA